VMNAIDPTMMAKGPGLGYGVKKAAQGVATHAANAANAPGANAMVKLHSTHVQAAANNVVAMCDDIMGIAHKIAMTTSLDEAKMLAQEMATKTQELTSGVDANKDGKINWDKPEGGLAQAEQHANFMKTAAAS